jgi:hypothetical protein
VQDAAIHLIENEDVAPIACINRLRRHNLGIFAGTDDADGMQALSGGEALDNDIVGGCRPDYARGDKPSQGEGINRVLHRFTGLPACG